MTLLPLLVIIAATLSFFLDEFSGALKKIFSISWLRVILPLLIMSSCAMSFKNNMLLILLSCQNYFRYLMVLVFQYLPNTMWGSHIAQLSVLFLMASLPVWCFYGVLKYKRFGKTLALATLMYSFLWLALLILWVA